MTTELLRTRRDYRDIDFSFIKHPATSNVSIKKTINAVRQSVSNLLTTRKGDRPFHPEIASPIYPFLFDNLTVVSKIVLENEVVKYIRAFEPRLSNIKVTINNPSPNALECIVSGEMINVEEPITVSTLIERLR